MTDKTVLVIRNAARADFGGAETYSVSLSILLEKNGFSPIVVTRSNKLLAHAKENDIRTKKCWWLPYQNWSGWRNLLTPMYVLWQLVLTVQYIYIIILTKADVLHIQSRDDFIAATLAGKVLRKRVVWTDHMDLRYVFQNIALPFRNIVGKLVFMAGKLADKIILISINEHRLVTNHFKHKEDLGDKIVIVRNGVIDSFGKDETTDDSASNFIFCLASRIVTNKGIYEAIEAFKILKKSRTSELIRKCLLEIYGDGPEIDRFKKFASDEPSINFHGHQQDILSKVNRSDVYILPSYQEGLSIALLEATMLGKAIIATNVDSNPEIVHDGETGLLIAPHNVKSLESAMHKLITDKSLRLKLERNARKNYLDNFNLSTIVAKEIIPLYEDR